MYACVNWFPVHRILPFSPLLLASMKKLLPKSNYVVYLFLFVIQNERTFPLSCYMKVIISKAQWSRLLTHKRNVFDWQKYILCCPSYRKSTAHDPLPDQQALILARSAAGVRSTQIVCQQCSHDREQHISVCLCVRTCVVFCLELCMHCTPPIQTVQLQMLHVKCITREVMILLQSHVIATRRIYVVSPYAVQSAYHRK